MNEDYEIWRIDNKIRRLLSPEEITISNSPIQRGKPFTKVLTLPEGKKDLQLHFQPFEGEIFPLISVFFNGQIIWEDYLHENVLTIPLETEIGENTLEIVPVNRTVDLMKITYSQTN